MTDLETEVWTTNTPAVSPSGILVEYRHDPRQYRVNGLEVPSVTQILDILHKPALTWWGMKVGVEGVQTLVDADIGSEQASYDIVRWISEKTVDEIVGLLTANKLTVNHVRDQAASRGSSVHQAFEDYCTHGIEPNPANYAPQERGYVEALMRFIDEVGFEVVLAEYMVGSERHGYAGRFDLLARTEAQEVQTGPRTKRKVPAGLGLIDLKTSKGVYTSHKLQLAAYAEALEECGHGRTDYEAVVLARSDGSYDFRVSDARPSQFLRVLDAYTAIQGL